MLKRYIADLRIGTKLVLITISTLVHETQRERGATGVLLSKGKSFAGALKAQQAR